MDQQTVVRSSRFGIGRVEFDKGESVIVRFEHGLEECERGTLELLTGLIQGIRQGSWDVAPEVTHRVQAECIQSINDAWGIFSRSRIALLPHQLWVCRKALERWPTRWLIADDVGLGKTIEAGLILWPLLARGSVKRLLILCPSSLVEQWQYRLRTMFDIRLAQYVSGADTEKSDFWNTHNQVVCSLQTLRQDHKGRHDRLFESQPWDLLLVDEAHHLNADEKTGPTLGYTFVEALGNRNLVSSIVFFTGTPHRGKNYGFLALLRLLRPDLFDPKKGLKDQLPYLRNVVIRNNKQNVTSIKGERLFRSPRVISETYSYSDEEARFYEMLTEFIATGKAYASSLAAQDARTVLLVLITMQKLASSSVAAIRRALKGRLGRIKAGRRELNDLITLFDELNSNGDFDKAAEIEERIAIQAADLKLMEHEEPRLKELVQAAENVKEETKIVKILDLVCNQYRDRPVLFFTEYKATQSLLMSALIGKFGSDSVTFINGDERADEVVVTRGQSITLHEPRDVASERFNSGEVRFLVSTEAAGEGVDLQESCHTLIHVDLPWNPMRLHQRVGRLNRYGQVHQVEVTNLRNPDTVESRIWDKLNAKIENIMRTLGTIMDEPEDLMQLVLGMTAPSLLTDLFSQADGVSREKLTGWFDEKTANFGGVDVIETVKNLVGHCARFDFEQVSSVIPKMDLPDLRPFFVSMLKHNRRLVKEDEGSLSFKTPEEWRKEIGILESYDAMVFERSNKPKDSLSKMLGVGHKLFDQAMKQARSSIACLALLGQQDLRHPVVVFSVRDRLTGTGAAVRQVIAATEIELGSPAEIRLLRDWQLLNQLNLTSARGARVRASLAPDRPNLLEETIRQGREFMIANLAVLELPFGLPTVEELAVFWPGYPTPSIDGSQEDSPLPDTIQEG